MKKERLSFKLSIFLPIWIRIQPTKINTDPCGPDQRHSNNLFPIALQKTKQLENRQGRSEHVPFVNLLSIM
jgi:hypothetical protein